jgi:hypothetical protein
MKRLVLLLLLSTVGCRWLRRDRGPESGSSEVSLDGARSEEVTPRGAVRSGTYIDPVWGYSIPVPVGWRWFEGPDPGSLRLRATDPSTGTTIEVWYFAGNDLRPRPRQDCAWLFYDHGRYAGPGPGPRRSVATCVPHVATEPRVFAWMVPSEAGVWQIEGRVYPDYMIRGDALVRSIVARFELSPGP